MKKVASQWNDFYSWAKPGSPSKRGGKIVKTPSPSRSSSGLVILFGSFYRSASFAFLFAIVIEFFILPKEWYWSLVSLPAGLLTSRLLAAWVGLMLFQGGEIVFPGRWRLWGQKCFSAGKWPGKEVYVWDDVSAVWEVCSLPVVEGRRRWWSAPLLSSILEGGHPCCPPKIQVNS